MSKKILKRSLALGALMAFVITGSAMAAEVKIDDSDWHNFGIKDGAGEVLDMTSGGDGPGTSWISVNGADATLKNYSEIIYTGDKFDYKDTSSYDSVFSSMHGSLTLTNIGTIKTVDNKNDLAQFFNAFTGSMNIEAKTIDIAGVNAAVRLNGMGANKDFTFTLNAEDITLGGKSGIYTYYEGNNGTKGTANITATNQLNVLATGSYGIMSANKHVVNANAKDVYIKSGYSGIYAYTGGVINIGLDDELVETENVTVDGEIDAVKGGTVNISASNSLTVNGMLYSYGSGDVSSITLDGGKETTINGQVWADGRVYDDDDDKYKDNGTAETITFNIKGDVITINADSGRAVFARGDYAPVGDSSTINLGESTTEQININDAYTGLWADYNGSKINVQGAELNIKSTIGEEAYSGILAMNGTVPEQWGDGTYVTSGGKTVAQTDDEIKDVAHITISENTVTNIDMRDESNNLASAAIVALSEGIVDIKGDLYASAKEAIIARGGATVNINNEGKNKVVQLTGDIDFNYDKDTSGTPIDANINLNLTNDKSFFTGKIIKSGAPYPTGYDQVKGMKINVTNGAVWNVTGESTVNNATFGAGSILNLVEGSDFTGDVYALKAGGATGDSLSVDQDAKLQIGGIKETTYNIAAGFENYNAVKGWTEIADNALMEANKVIDTKNKTLQVEIKTKEAEQMATEMGVSNSTAQSLANLTAAAQSANVNADANGSGDAKAVALVNAIANAPSEVAGQVFEAVSKMAEAGGNSATAASIVKNVTGVTNDRLSFNCGHSAPHKGGHGVGLFEEGSGADVWVEYVHGKDKVEDMPSTAGKTSYEGQYNGIVMGVDFKKVNKFQSGFAFNYGEGDTNSVGSAARTHSDYDFWGIGYYGSIHNDDSNVIFDIGYAKTDSDVETKALGMTYNASPETTTWTAGVKVEKLYQNENVQIVPYTGLRFMSIDPEDYSTECASSKYQMERQNVWLLPLGVSIKQEVTNDNGWTVSPRVDLSYIWAFGDTDSEMEFSSLGTKTNIGYEVMDDGSFLGLVGIEAHKGQWGFGVSYSYQKGDYSTSKKWFIDANYSF